MAAVQNRNGFTLVEVLIAVILVGLSITALVMSSNSFTMANSIGADLSTAEFLVEQIRELTVLLPVVDPTTGVATFGPEEPNLATYDDIDDFDTLTFSPPISAAREALNDLAGFSQYVTVQNVLASNFETVQADHSTSFVRITVSVRKNGEEITSASWLRARF